MPKEQVLRPTLRYSVLARHLRKNFPVTVRNGNWTEKTVARILRNPTYIGKRWVSIQGTPKLVPFVSEPLIDEKLFWKVQEFEEKRRIHPVPYRKYPAALLSGGVWSPKTRQGAVHLSVIIAAMPVGVVTNVTKAKG